MKFIFRRVWVTGAGIAAMAAVTVSGLNIIGAAMHDGAAFAQTHSVDSGPEHGHSMSSADVGTSEVPILPGQDAFGAIQEIVSILEADKTTDWSKIDLDRLRQHLVDMNEVTLHSDARPKNIEGGVSIDVTGSGRTLAAIQRMVADQGIELHQSHLNGWDAATEPLANGVRLIVTSADPREIQHIRGLGFIGIMVSGGHHQLHHLAMARGEMLH